MRALGFVLALALLPLCARAEIKRWPKVMGLTIGMKLADVRAALGAHKARFKERDDDKPVRGRSVKIKAAFPDGASVKRATLYLLDGRLWQIKLRPGGKLCKALGRKLGAALGRGSGVTVWGNRARLWGAFCGAGRAQLMDMSAMVRAGVERGRVEADFKGFLGAVGGK